MKKLSPAERLEIRGVVLYLDDIEKVVELLGEVSSSVQLSSDDYLYDNIEDMKKNVTEWALQSFTISTDRASKDPYISVSVYSWGSVVYRNDSSPASVGVFHKLATLLNSKRPLLRRVYEPIPGLILSLLVGILLGAICLLLKFEILVIELVSMGSIWILQVILWRSYKKFPTVYLKPRDQMPSFWTQHREKIIVGIVSSILTAAITAVFKALGPK